MSVSTTANRTVPQPDAATLERNLVAIARRNPRTAALIRQASPRTDVTFEVAADGGLSGVIGSGTAARALASRRRPLTEASRFADSVDLFAHGAIAIAGFGLGHHLAAIAQRAGEYGVLIVFEPDLPLLRAVLERQDCAAWIERTHLVLVTDANDAAGMTSAMTQLEALVALGVQLKDHPACLPRLGTDSQRFAETVTGVVRALRTTITTTLVQAQTTLRNALMNIDRYADAAPLADLAGAAAGRTAIVVSAGPSLQRNLDLLADPGVRDRVVIIAVQTVLRTMLDKGIRPHLVVALDHHEISTRFYEGLTADDVQGVTLVVEPKVNPAVLEAFPGTIRCASDERLDSMLGEALARPMGTIEPGATVAHLAYHLARFLRCDPVVLIGQDLGFTDGQYYAAGAAIHRVWSSELNEFRTLEMLEWERIVRGRHRLTRTTDQLGRPIYTDEQMHNYLTLFERSFAADAAQGLRVIDATEGGITKAHTEIATLKQVLGAIPPGPPIRLPEPVSTSSSLTHDRQNQLDQRVRTVRQETWRVAELSRQTADMLGEMLEHHTDQARVNGLITRVDAVRNEITKLQPAFDLVQFMNQVGGLNRLKADRMIELETTLTPMERQARQIERDRTNVRWLADAADELGDTLDTTSRMIRGGPRITRDLPPKPDGALARRTQTKRSVAAIIPVDCARSGLGTQRDLAEPFLLGTNPLNMTLARLARCCSIDRAILLTDEPERVAALLDEPPKGLRIEVVQCAFDPDRARAIASARLFSPTCWRGSLAGLTCYDELFDPVALASVMDDLDIELGALVGADWALVDPGLVDQIVARAHEGGDRLAFSQVPPGLGTCVVERSLVQEIASQITTAGPFASIGGLLGYLPSAPRYDQIARPWCATIPAIVRDLPMRVIPDTPSRRRTLAGALGHFGPGLLDADTTTIARALMHTAPQSNHPQQVELELNTGRLTSGLRRRWLCPAGEWPERRPITPEQVASIVSQLTADGPGLALTLAGAGDPLGHPALLEIIAAARSAGAGGIHLRTDLLGDASTIDALARAPIDIISVDLLATERATYATITGIDQLDRVRANLEQLIAAARTGPAFALPWIVPRITRCDLVYEQIESFYDHWLSRLGACVIDPLGAPIAGDRIAPLPVPEPARSRLASKIIIRCDGTVESPRGEIVGNLLDESLGDVLRRAGPETATAVAEPLVA